MAKRPITPRTEARDVATASTPPSTAGRMPVSSTAIDVERERQAESGRSGADGPGEEDIRIRAYHRYLERGGGDGMAFDDWLEAEREIRDGKVRT